MGYFNPPKYVFDIRFEIWPILREMGVKKGVVKELYKYIQEIHVFP